MKKHILFLIAIVALAGCDVEKVTGDFTLGLKPELMNYTVMLEAYDATDQAVIPSNLQMTVVSSNSDDVYEASGSKNFSLTDGRIEIGLHPRANPTPTEPVNVRVLFTGDNYINTYLDVLFTVNDSNQLVSTPMVDKGNPPSGVNFETRNTALDGDSLSTTFQASLAPVSGSSVGMSIDMAQGTSFFDANGNALSGASLDLDLGQFDPSSESALAAFPGGFAPDSISLPDGQGSSGNFVTAGFTAMNMSVNGVEVKSFSKPITVTMDLAAGAVNPETGTVIVLNDSVPVWSYDEALGVWAYETTGVAIQGTNGLQVQYQASHLSWWNLDFYGARCCGGRWTRQNNRWSYVYLGPCATLSINLPGWADGVKDNFLIKVVYAGTNQAVSRYASRSRFVGNGSTITYNNVPNFPVQIKAYDLRGTTLLGQTSNISLCSGSPSLTIMATPPTPITFAVEGYCADNSSISVKPSFYVYFKETSQSYYRYLGYVSQGVGSTVGVEVGKTYDFRAYYNGETIDTTALVDQVNYNIRLELGDFCNDL